RAASLVAVSQQFGGLLAALVETAGWRDARTVALRGRRRCVGARIPGILPAECRGPQGPARTGGHHPHTRRTMEATKEELLRRIEDQTAGVGIVGLGYVGLPLAVEMARSGYRTIGFEISPAVVEGVMRGESHIGDVPSELLKAYVGEGLLSATTDLSRLSDCDAIAICVPTPLSKTKDPDLSYVAAATQSIRATLRPEQLIVLESTTYPGTTR